MSEMSDRRRPRTAGVFDIRTVIGALLGLYGVILLVTRAVSGDEGGANSEGVNANLWTGLALLVVGVGFITWARVRPVRVAERDDAAPDGSGDGSGDG